MGGVGVGGGVRVGRGYMSTAVVNCLICIMAGAKYNCEMFSNQSLSCNAAARF